MAREPFNRIWTETPTVDFDEPTNNMWVEGWRGGPDQDPPEAYAQNWWQNRADYALRAIERLGAMVWHERARYQRGAVTVGSDGEKYLSVTGTETSPNSGNDPVSDGGQNWILYYDGGPPGQVSAFARDAPPAGWLSANGAEVSRDQYSRLFNAIGTTFGSGNGDSTFNLPDLRGEFVRGWSEGTSYLDTSRVFGTQQSDQFRAHSHSGNTDNYSHSHGGSTDSDSHSHSGNTDNYSHSHGGSTGINTHSHRTNWQVSSEGDDTRFITSGNANRIEGNFTGSTETDTHSHSISTDTNTHNHSISTDTNTHNHSISTDTNTHDHNFRTNSTGGVETRPSNVALLYCIKY